MITISTISNVVEILVAPSLPGFQKGARNTQHLSVSTTFVESESGKVTTQYDFQPSVGVHLIRFGFKIVYEPKSPIC
jgi:hypothetical protein